MFVGGEDLGDQSGPPGLEAGPPEPKFFGVPPTNARLITARRYASGLCCRPVSIHPSIHPSVYFADKYKQVNIKIHLQGEWKKRGVHSPIVYYCISSEDFKQQTLSIRSFVCHVGGLYPHG